MDQAEAEGMQFWSQQENRPGQKPVDQPWH